MGAKIKVLYVHHSGPDSGAARSLAFLIRALDKSAWEPVVVCHHEFEKNKELFEASGASVIHGAYIGGWHGSTVNPVTRAVLNYNIKHLLPSYFGIKQIVRSVNPDIIHLNSTCLCYVAKSIHRSFHWIPLVCHAREPLTEDHWGNILRRNCEKSVDRFIAISHCDAESLHSTKPVEIVYNFVDFNVYHEKISADCLRQELKLSQREKIILYLARVTPVNGAREFAESSEAFFEKHPDIHLCIVGAGVNDTSVYLNEVRRIVTRHKNMHLFAFRRDVPQMIASSDLMIVPFQAPHFARCIVEAAAMGIPSLASDVGGVNELIINGETGYLLNPHGFNGFDEICLGLLKDPREYARISRNAVLFAHEHFDAVKNTQRICALYEDMISSRRQ